jgi:hypothetical protein
MDWDWTKARVDEQLKALHPTLCISSLAIGSDQLFAEEALRKTIPVLAVIPLANYEHCFKDANIQRYRDLLAKCSVLNLDGKGNEEKCFLEAGKVIVDRSDVMIAIWDGHPAAGKGGTADVVEYALCKRTPLIHLDPVNRTVTKHRLPDAR